jgi:hypothetical protein
MINKQNLINWLHDQIDMEWTCVDDMEITENEEYTWGRGKVAAWEQLLKVLEKEG